MYGTERRNSYIPGGGGGGGGGVSGQRGNNAGYATAGILYATAKRPIPKKRRPLYVTAIRPILTTYMYKDALLLIEEIIMKQINKNIL